jgi:RNA polymerase-binding transcription factor DksA
MRVSPPRLSDVQVDEVRTLLLNAIAEEYTEFERQEAVVVADWPEDTTGLIRAMAALRMFSAREAIEAIASALVRIDGGDFGLCSSCSRPIPFELLETIPPTRFCVGCRPRDSVGGQAVTQPSDADQATDAQGSAGHREQALPSTSSNACSPDLTVSRQ